MADKVAGLDRIREFLANRQLAVTPEERALLILVMKKMHGPMLELDDLQVPFQLVLYGLSAWAAREIGNELTEPLDRKDAVAVLASLIDAMIAQVDITKQEQHEAAEQFLNHVFGATHTKEKKKGDKVH